MRCFLIFPITNTTLKDTFKYLNSSNIDCRKGFGCRFNEYFCKILYGVYIIKDTLKFFQAYIREMIDVGGTNLPKAISTKSGAKLGKVYKEKGFIPKIENALSQIYIALKAKPIVKKLNDNQYEVIVKYPKDFCSIGGSNHSSRTKIFQESICIPYTKGFLNEIFPQYKFEADIINCIPLNGRKTCHYMLKVSNRRNTI